MSDTGFISVPVVTFEDDLVDAALDYLIANIPGWLPSDGNVEVWVLQTMARVVNQLASIYAEVPIAVYRHFGTRLVGIAPVDAAAATGTTSWTLADASGWTIPAGTVVAFRVAGDTLIPFTTVGEVIVPPGTTTATVSIQAIDNGTGGNGLTGVVELVDTLAFVELNGITTVGFTGGGVDAELDDLYLDRLTAELQLLAPRPILPADFAVMARRVSGVFRATAIDNYDPVAGTFNNERMVTVAVVDVAGQPLAAPVIAAVDALLEAEREVNFIVHVVTPVYQAVSVTFAATSFVGADPAVVLADATAAVAAYLSPGNWAGGTADPPRWDNDTTVRFLEIATILNQVDGLNHVTALTVNGGTADVVLTGVIVLPTAGVISGSVT